MNSDFDGRWSGLSRAALQQVKQWRLAHPQATLNEIEQALDAQLGQLRARLLEDLAQASDAAQLDEQTVAPPRCQQCGEQLRGRGAHVRELATAHQQQLRLERTRRHLPTLRRWAFPPWMKSWGCCLES